jgi:hypothetical protein
MNLIDLALTTFTESEAERADTAGDLASEARAEFLKHARSSAANTLCQDAGDLDWQYVTEDLPDEVEEARALLQPGRPEYLRYRIDHSEGAVALELVQPRAADRISPITSLFHLGQLLTEDRPDPAHTSDGGGRESSPLAAVERAEQGAAQAAAVARRLLAEYLSAGLSVARVVVFGHDDGDGSTELHLTAGDLGTLRRIADVAGAEVTARVSGTHPSMVLEHGDTTLKVDDVTVHLRAYNKLPDDQAAAWLAQQNQPTAAASDDGGA